MFLYILQRLGKIHFSELMENKKHLVNESFKELIMK